MTSTEELLVGVICVLVSSFLGYVWLTILELTKRQRKIDDLERQLEKATCNADTYRMKSKLDRASLIHLINATEEAIRESRNTCSP